MDAKQFEGLKAYLGGDNLTKEELLQLNKVVVGRIREIQRAREVQAASQFRIGDVVSFYTRRYGERLRIRITKINEKSLSGVEVNAPTKRWNVSPSLCSKAEGIAAAL